MVIDTNGLFNDLSKKFNLELEAVESLAVVSENIGELENMLENFDKIENADFSVKNSYEDSDEDSDEDDFEEDLDEEDFDEEDLDEEDLDDDFDDDFDESELDELDEDDLDDLEEFDDDDLDEEDFEAKSVPEYQSIEKIMEMV